MVPNPFRVAIIGGGITGLTTALFIQHFCGSHPIQIDVYEQAERYRDTGGGINIGVNAARLLHAIGVGDACNAIAGCKDGVWFTFRRWDTSDEITTIHSRDQGKIRQAAVSRAGFLKVLLKFLAERKAAKLHMKKKYLRVENLGHRMEIRFTDGSSVDADLVLGCDGIHSRVRRQFVQDEAMYMGKIVYRGVIPMSQVAPIWDLPSHSVMFIGRGKHLVTYPIDANQTLNFVGCFIEEEDKLGDLRESWSTTCDRAELLEKCGDGAELVRKVLALAPEKPSKWLVNDRKPIPDWTFQGGKVALMGDAAHPMVPHQSAGAGQGIEDGYIIARSLAEHLDRRPAGNQISTDLEKWMHLYQRVRLPRASKVQQTSRDSGLLYHLRGPAMQGKTDEECMDILAKTVQERINWILGEDLDALYERERTQMLRLLEGAKIKTEQ